MKYMLLIYEKEIALNPEIRHECYQESGELIEDIAKKGQFLASAPLRPTDCSTSVQVRNGKRLVTDGPFAETLEQLGGYYLIDVPGLDEAISIASRIPSARRGTIEVRPVVELDENLEEVA